MPDGALTLPRLGSFVMCCGVALATQGEVASPLVTLAPSDTNTEDRVVVKMRGRQFEPRSFCCRSDELPRLCFRTRMPSCTRLCLATSLSG